MARPADPRRRETILHAATEVFIEQGFSETRLADIARRAGVVISTLYLYFDSKEAMVHAIAHENQQLLLQQLRPIVEHLKGEEDIVRFVETVYTFAREHRDQIIVFNLDEGLRSVQRGWGWAQNGQGMQRGRDIISHLIDEGYLYPYDPRRVIEMLIMTTRWIIRSYLALENEEEEEPLKQFCVQWLSRSLLNAQKHQEGANA